LYILYARVYTMSRDKGGEYFGFSFMLGMLQVLLTRINIKSAQQLLV